MLRSMTAFGRGALDYEGMHFAVEIQSVNRKHLEIQIHLPRTLSILETEVRSRVANEVFRGQILVRVQVVFHGKSPYRFQPNLPLAKEIKRAWDEIGEALGEKAFSSDALLASPDVLVSEIDEHEIKNIKGGLEQAIEKCLNELIHMKEKEGRAIEEDFLPRLKAMENKVLFIEELSKGAPEKWRKKILSRIEEIASLTETDERLLKEIALMAERLDITEECVRFRSHVMQFKDVMHQKGAVGKTLEFILQELGREINTIGSKCQDVEISKTIIEVKGEIEKIREQVQNVE